MLFYTCVWDADSLYMKVKCAAPQFIRSWFSKWGISFVPTVIFRANSKYHFYGVVHNMYQVGVVDGVGREIKKKADFHRMTISPIVTKLCLNRISYLTQTLVKSESVEHQI